MHSHNHNSYSFIMTQSEGGWVPWIFFPGMLPGITDNGGVGGERPDGANVPQWVPVMFPVQMPMFLPLPPPDQAAQTGGLYAVPLLPIYGPMGMGPQGSPGALKFPSPLYVVSLCPRNMYLLPII